MITKDDLYQELNANAKEEQVNEKINAIARINAKFYLLLFLIIIGIVSIFVFLISTMIDEQDNKLMFMVCMPAALILLFIILFQFKFRVKYVARKLKSIQIKNIDDIIKEQIIQEIESSPDTIEWYKKRLKEATDNLREAEERLTLLKQLQWRYVKTLTDMNPKFGEFYSVLLVEGGHRFVAYIDNNTKAIISDLRIKRTNELFDPHRLTFEEARLTVKKEIADFQKEKPSDVKDLENLKSLSRNTIDFYDKLLTES